MWRLACNRSADRRRHSVSCIRVIEVTDSQPQTQSAFPLALITCTGLAFALWSGYCFLIAKQPATFDQPLVRAIVRIVCVLIPAIVFQLWHARRFPEMPNGDPFGFRRNWVWGLITGMVVAAILAGLILFDPMRSEARAVPTDVATWLNFIIGSPLAEEMLFRCVIAIQIYSISQNLDGAKGWDSWISAIILSSVLFAAFHVPGWLAANQFAPREMIVESAKLFGYGAAFAVVFLVTRSIWAPLIPHCVNNFMLQLYP